MTKVYSLRAVFISLMFVAASFALLAVQYVAGFFTQGLADSAGIRVSANTACSATDTHFTGCSSIL